jgi:large subunit ribosomal protein L3
MPKRVNPRRGSLQFWPRVRAKKETARVRSWAKSNEVKILGFAGYKVGMTHIIYTDNIKNSMTKGQDVSSPVTIIECPPVKVYSIRFYKKTLDGVIVVSDIVSEKNDKELSRKLTVPKKVKNKLEDIKDFDFIHLTLYTQPKFTSLNKKKPELFEVALGGKKDEQLAFAKEKLGKEILLTDVIKEGQLVDAHAVTTGKGFQGPVKRFGVKIRFRKSEKTKRGPGSLGGWKAQGHFMWRNPLAGKMGYHLRIDYNKWIMKISDKPEEINPKGGFINYGFVKNSYLLVKGSIPGPKKRLITLTLPIRFKKTDFIEAPSIVYTSLESKQG